ncbi:PH domain-containing protein [Staphylococcus sp. Marseille-Q6910]|uniref:PH domain-containing protein n=1 Tax=Staphylococcus sp. Marseille-Q6910 TaxID=2937990 RepID=UPI00203BA70B|nr:PH domain-containing protein [Staphylococcus sp. Marseille-Q6910]
MMSRPQKLHPISYLSGLINVIKQNIVFIIIFSLFNLRSFDFTNLQNYIFPDIYLGFLLIVSIYQGVKIYNTRYWIEDDHFILQTGVFSKSKKELNIRRIQSMETSQGLLSQIVNGVELHIKTPSDGINLETVTKQQSQLIRESIIDRQKALEDKGEVKAQRVENLEHQSQQTHMYQLNFKELLTMSMTSGAIGVTFVTLSPIVGAFSDHFPWHWLGTVLGSLSSSILLKVILFLIGLLILSYICGVILVVIRYYNYTLTRQGNQLHIKYGLLNIKNITVPTDRVQAVIEKQSFIRALLGYTSIQFLITSDDNDLSSDNEATAEGNVMILPFIHKRQAYDILAKLIPQMAFKDTRKGKPWRSYHKHFWVQSVVILVIAEIINYFWQPWIFILAAILIIYLILQSIIVVKQSGLELFKNELAVRKVTLFGYKNSYLKHDNLLGLEINTTPISEKSDLANFNFIIAKGMGSEYIGLDYINESEVEMLREWYLKGVDYDSI